MRKPRPGSGSSDIRTPGSGLCGELDMGHCLRPCHRVLESHWFVWITQMNHIPKEIGHEKHRDWASSQVGGGHWGRVSWWQSSSGEPAVPSTGCVLRVSVRASLPHLPPTDPLQLAATCNVEPSAFNDWFSGHLNFQIEHQ